MKDYVYEGRTKCGCFGAFVSDRDEHSQETIDGVMEMLRSDLIVRRIERDQLDLNDCAEHRQP